LARALSAEVADQRGADTVTLVVGPSLTMLSIFGIASKGAESAQSSLLRAIAYVDTNPQHDHSKMQFAGNVAQKRGLQVQPFATVAAAKRWLGELTASGAEA
jgi:hypothetical protein